MKEKNCPPQCQRTCNGWQTKIEDKQATETQGAVNVEAKATSNIKKEQTNMKMACPYEKMPMCGEKPTEDPLSPWMRNDKDWIPTKTAR